MPCAARFAFRCSRIARNVLLRKRQLPARRGDRRITCGAASMTRYKRVISRRASGSCSGDGSSLPGWRGGRAEPVPSPGHHRPLRNRRLPGARKPGHREGRRRESRHRRAVPAEVSVAGTRPGPPRGTGREAESPTSGAHRTMSSANQPGWPRRADRRQRTIAIVAVVLINGVRVNGFHRPVHLSLEAFGGSSWRAGIGSRAGG